MLRRAVIQRLRAQVSTLGGRAYQAFVAPANAAKPYVTVKVPAARASAAISYAGTQPVEVRLYDEPASFIALDDLEAAVVAALHGVEVEDSHETPPGRYRLDWVPGGGDFADEELSLIGRLVVFEAAILNERGA